MRQQDYGGEVPDLSFRRHHQFSRQRFELLVQYVCWICEDPRVLGVERLNRVLWYVDRNLYLHRDRVATGATYLRHRSGPWAKPLEAVLRDLERKGLVAQRARIGDREPDLLVSLAKPDLGRFDPEEISTVEAVTRAICFDSRASIPRRDAHDAVLHAARLGEVIPYFTVCAGRPGELTSADVAWATRESERHPGKGGAIELRTDQPSARLRETVEALLWHLLRDPSLGASLPGTGASWFAYRQLGVAGSESPDVTVVYRFEADELVLGGLRVAKGGGDDDDGDEDGT
jgi:hypothetical protein